MNGATIHSTSPKRYSPSAKPVAPLPCLPLLGSTSKAPPPIAMRGGSAGEPKVICAAAGCAAATPSATRMPVPALFAAPLRLQHQLLANAGLHRRVPGIGYDYIFRLRPGTRELVGAANWADHIIAP